ncbi:MAG: hypothetical protein FWF03_00060 [Defluviitaleaceae bacterium]|nr:hypothetical protein [Defluviitaleaceae bacterium]
MANSDELLWAPVQSNIVDYRDVLYKPRTPESSLDKDAFLRLLITQMKYQDPLNPMDDRDFLGQMAQFTALEQMQNLNKAYLQTQAYSMIGKSVYAYFLEQLTNEYVEVAGVVSAVTMKNGEAFLFVDGYDVPLSSVNIVGDDYITANQLNEIYESVNNTRNQGYVGKYVQALLIDSKGNVTDYVEGVVDYVKQNGKQSVLVVGNKEVFPSEVTAVSDKPLLLGKSVNVQITEGGQTTLLENAVITGVIIRDNKAYLQFGSQSVAIDKINYVMEALACVGFSVNLNGVSGTVESVTIKYGIPYLNVGDKELSYLEYLDSIK